MSISNRHNINLFVAGKSEPLTGQRLAKIGYKSSKNAPAKFPSVCASVPQIPVAEIIEDISAMHRLTPHLKGFLETAQDGIIRSLYESSGGTRKSVGDEEIGIEQIIAFLDSQANGGRLSKEFLESWFDAQCSDGLTVVIAEKLGFDLSTPEQEATVKKHVSVYKDLISSLAGNKTILTDVQMNACKKALELCSVDDDTSIKLIEKLDGMAKKPKIEELLEL